MVGIFLFTGIAFFCAILLNLASYFFDRKDPKVEAVLEQLPGFNCGGCGNSGCSEMARKIVYENESPKKCRPLKEEKAAKIQEILNRQGFTLVELLAVIVVVGLLATLVFAGIQGALERNKTRQYEITKELILAAAKTYIRDNRGSITDLDAIGTSYFLPLATLQDGIYLEEGELLDPRYNKDIPKSSFVAVFRETKEHYTYQFVNANEDGIVILPLYLPTFLKQSDSLPVFTAVAFEHGVLMDSSVTVTHNLPSEDGKLTVIGTYTVTMRLGEVILTKEVVVGETEDIKEVTSGLNGAEPELKGDLVPVTIANDGTVKKANTTKKWYDYDNKEWANAVILVDKSVTYEVLETIPESNIESYFVWIPRYKYKIFDEGTYTGATALEDGKTQSIEIIFEGKTVAPSSGTTKGSWLTHPAFTSFDVNGFWVGKFEVGYKGATTATMAEKSESNATKVIVKPNVYSWRRNTLKNFFETMYNYNRSLDSHMMKNTEWGAVAYLSHSKYGKNSELGMNNYYASDEDRFRTGCGDIPGSVGNAICNEYKSEKGMLASTTGNITGIYDMNGCAWEMVAGYRANTYGNSGFDASSIAVYQGKYFDVYNEASEKTTYQYRILGDATGEMGPFYDDNGYQSSWYGDYADFVDSSGPWFGRGGNYSNGSLAGVFLFSQSSGIAYLHGSTRLVLAP